MNSDVSNLKKDILKNVNLRCTQARLDVLDVLRQSDTPLTQKQITDSLNDKYDKVTIYRTLYAFLNADIVHRAFLHKREWYFEFADRCSKHQCHPHFSCRLCGRNFCLDRIHYPSIRMPANFEALQQKVLIEGVCPDCKN